MALSDTYTAVTNFNKLGIIKDSLIEAGVIRDDEAIPAEMNAWMSRTLNRLIKSLQSRDCIYGGRWKLHSCLRRARWSTL